MNTTATAVSAATAAPTAVDTIARTCLYEGYLLWPYRRSALKNTKRWTFGGVFPGGECAEVLAEPASITTEVLLEHGGTPREVAVRLRFLQVVDRQVVREGPHGPEPVDELTVDGERHLAWQEATEREVLITVTVPGGPRHTAVHIPEGSGTEHLTDSSGRLVGSIIRSWRRLTGVLTLSRSRRRTAWTGSPCEWRTPPPARCPSPPTGTPASGPPRTPSRPPM